MMCGGPSEEKDITDDVKQICEKIKADVEAKVNQQYNMFIPLKYKTQVVAGTNYFIKIQVTDDKCIHVRVFESLPHAGRTLDVHSIQSDKTLQEPIENF